MNVSLTPELERLVQKKVDSGLYQTASEVVREALRLLGEQDHLRSLQIAETRKRIQLGLQQLATGQGIAEEDVRTRLAARKQKRKAG